MELGDRARAEHFLTHISYYRLRAYWLPFEIRQQPGQDGHAFRPGTTFDDVIALYVFDRELRLLVMDAIERFEVSLRSVMANHLGLAHGPFAHCQSHLFRDPKVWGDTSADLAKEYQRSRETFAEHFRTKYTGLSSPPIWAATELMAFGQLSRWLANLAAPADRQRIAAAYFLDERILVSFTHHLSIVRNHCAHHSRLWNRSLSFKMMLPTKKPKGIASNFNVQAPGKLYNTLTMLVYLLGIISPGATWRQRVVDLLKANPGIRVSDMGFPADWETRPLWQ